MSCLKKKINRNKLQSMKTTEETLSLEPLRDKLIAFGWNVIEVDGHNHNELFKFVTTKRKFKLLSATYNKTKKNIQVENFFELKGFEVIYKSDESKKYQMKVKNYNMKTKYNIATLWKKK